MADSTKYMMRIPKSLKEALARRADMMGISLNSLLVQVLLTYMEEKEGMNYETPDKLAQVSPLDGNY